MDILNKFLFDIGSIKLQPNNLFTWASGKKSPIYCDNRLTNSFPEIRKYICDLFINRIKEIYPNVEAIAGVATGGIAQGILIADRLNLPFVYIRDKPKAHGTQNLIEGKLTPKSKVVVIEDLISTGKSSLNAVNTLRDSDYNVLGMLAIFTYGFEESILNFKNSDCKLDTLTNFHSFLAFLEKENKFNSQDINFMKNWILQN